MSLHPLSEPGAVEANGSHIGRDPGFVVSDHPSVIGSCVCLRHCLST